MHGKLPGAGPTTGTKEADTLGPVQSLKIVSAEQQVTAVPLA